MIAAITWPLAVVIVAFLAFLSAKEVFRFRGEIKLVKDAGVAILKHDARLNSIERALEAATSERIA